MEVQIGSFPSEYVLFTHLVNLSDSELIGYDVFALAYEDGDDWAGFAITSRVGKVSNCLAWIDIGEAGALVEMWRWWRKHESEYKID